MEKYEVHRLPLDKIDKNPLNPRGRGDEGDIKHLLESIRESSLYYPILVNKKGERYQIVEGHRRFNVYTTLKERNPDFASIPALVIEVGQEYMGKIFREINDTAKKLTGKQWLDVFALGGKPADLPTRLKPAITALGELFTPSELSAIADRQGPSVHGLARRVCTWLATGDGAYNADDPAALRKVIAWLVNSGDSVNVRVAITEGTTAKTLEAIKNKRRLNGSPFVNGEVVPYDKPADPVALAAE